jgi:hypothetical protein
MIALEIPYLSRQFWRAAQLSEFVTFEAPLEAFGSLCSVLGRSRDRKHLHSWVSSSPAESTADALVNWSMNKRRHIRGRQVAFSAFCMQGCPCSTENRVTAV